MLTAPVYVAYDHFLGRTVLDRLSEQHHVPIALFDERATPNPEHIVFVVSEGLFPSHFLRILPENTEEQPDRRFKDVMARRFEFPDRVLCAQRVIVLKPPAKGSLYSGAEQYRFFQAIERACGFPTTSARPARYIDHHARISQKRLDRISEQRAEIGIPFNS